jgi:penicillin-insensitive murein endopeptidase
VKIQDPVPTIGSRVQKVPFVFRLACAAFGLSGCWAAQSPLTPNFEGSIGVPLHGVQTGSEELPKSGLGYRRFRQFGDYNFGRPRLIQAIEEVSRRIAEEVPGSPPLVIGDLSGRYGGKIPRHNSHRSGRDVDLLWFVTTPRGAPVQNPGFIRIEADGLAATNDGYLRLDVERQWALVKALLESEHVAVQWMFCSRDIEAQLIDYALSRGEDLELVWHAETVLLQPADSLPHDDHIHLRVACTKEEMLRGCQGGGPHWQWLGTLPALELSDEELVRELLAEDPPEPLSPPQPEASEPTAEPTASLVGSR